MYPEIYRMTSEGEVISKLQNDDEIAIIESVEYMSKYLKLESEGKAAENDAEKLIQLREELKNMMTSALREIYILCDDLNFCRNKYGFHFKESHLSYPLTNMVDLNKCLKHNLEKGFEILDEFCQNLKFSGDKNMHRDLLLINQQWPLRKSASGFVGMLGHLLQSSKAYSSCLGYSPQSYFNLNLNIDDNSIDITHNIPPTDLCFYIIDSVNGQNINHFCRLNPGSIFDLFGATSLNVKRLKRAQFDLLQYNIYDWVFHFIIGNFSLLRI
ncbi:hypothetical protein RF11_09353 [Thelohanellus kitauei]|uniref:Uncharacterized protein n=1 Tax=Thelohanellus kitauei TaxID=669202 RepID=A0A0C2M3V2_THEKT|nr:hypothetical protein RF11_09353 [Thelohanellus kitauei]